MIRTWAETASRVALLLALFVLAGCSGKDKADKADGKDGDKKESDKKDDDKKHSNLADAKADFALASTELSEEYKKNQKAASDKYKDKVIELTGKVKWFGSSPNRGPFLSLEGAKGDFIGVMCFTAEKLPWAKATPGQTVKLKGKYFGLLQLSMYECVLTDVKGDRALELTTEALAKEFTADAEATNTKYEKKYLILTGEVTGKKTNEVGAVSLTLKGDGKTKVKCSFTAMDKEESAKIKEGQKVKVIGEYSSLYGDEDEAAIGTSVLMEAPK